MLTTSRKTSRQTPAKPGVRLLILPAVFVPVYAAFALLNQAVADHPLPALLAGLLTAVAAIGTYVALVRRVEQRPVTELALPRLGADAGRGALLGAGLFTVTLAVIALGGATVRSGSLGALVASVGLMSFAAVGEEILFRGIVFRLLEQWLGLRAALVLSALVFGGLHLVNPHATVGGAVAIAVEGGLMLAAGFAATRSLWVVIGVHFGWNLAEGGLFGTTVSGSDAGATGLLHTALHGPALLTGGGFGPEASLVAIAVCLVPTVYWLRRIRFQPPALAE